MTFENSTIHAQTIRKSDPTMSKGMYYNASYEIENFIQVYQDNSEGDPFKVLNDPIYTGFKIFFHFDAKSGLLADEDYTNSALAYLKRIGQMERYELLKRFIVVLSKVNSICPWIFQEISGLQELYQHTRRSNPLFDQELVISTLETIDGKIMSLNEMYRMISWDADRGCDVLPDNLRKFSMSIYVHDFRIFDNYSLTAAQLLQTLDNTDIRKLNHILFDLGHCQFTEGSGSSYFDEVKNNRSESNNADLTIHCNAASISSLFKTITGDTKLIASAFELPKIGTVGTLGGGTDRKWVSRLEDRLLKNGLVQSATTQYEDLTSLDGWKTKLGRVIDNTTETIVDAAQSALTRLYLGNVNGFGFDDLLRLKENSDAGSLINQLVDGNSRLTSLKTKGTSNLGNANN